MVATATLLPGFADPVFDAQAVFRAAMDALARPGTIQQIGCPLTPPKGLCAASAALMLTLCDYDTPVYLSAALAQGVVPGWLGFHAGAKITSDKSTCAFAFFEKGSTLPAFGHFSQGTQDYPDRSTTIILEVASLEGGARLSLSGPGINGATEIAPLGLPATFLDQWRVNRALFPRGIDLILTCSNRLIGLPRTVNIKALEG
ncbi:phosphonate C-P lyase system protein PhnH [Rhizobium sp. FKY42]|uniref:phosphonate C-P lyase system protein PhnH n=1 Tax=Rhizobium sp. FKY42 TaxID=2562310 RepID=UPI0010C0A0BE|nr:phosphonate C-P lyase system protein PhnH [Rhizobium sp. FKY42]